MLPEEIPFGQYTDIIFSFATINPDTFKVSAGDSQTQYLLERMKSLKIIQPDLKIWVALGGWAFNDPGPTQTTFSDIASSEDNIDTFLDSLVSMMNTYSLDGVDIDWEYPVAEDRHGKDEDFENIVTFMKKLRSRMSAADRGTSMAIPASYWYLRHFDIKALEPQVDWFNLMSYDMHGSWDIDNEFTGPWANSHTNMTEIQMALDLLWRNDISASKVTMGMAFYSRTFTLTDPNCNKLGCRVSSGGNAGECSDTVGVLLHPEIADIVADKKLTPVPDRTGAVKIVSWDNQWTTFDDAATWRLKGNIARSQCIEGFMVWAMSQDDSKGTNIKALNQALGRKTPDFPDFTPSDPPDPLPASNPKLCRWTSCFEGCPSGFKEVQRDGHKEIMMDTSICFDEDDKFSNHIGFARLCCPSENTLPTCTWRGHKNSGNCRPGCEDDEVEVGTLKTGCKKNHQSACCKSTSVTESYGECFWSDCSKDAATICGQSLTLVTTSPNGWGGHKQCSGDYEARALCCNDPPPAAFDTSCKWYPKVGLHDDNKFCEGACPKDSVKLSLWLGFHWVKGSEYCYGYNAFCCPDPKQIVERDDEYEEDQISQQWAKQFRKLLEEYAEDPTCPRDDLDLAFHDDRARGYDAKKRSLTVESNQYEVLHGRAEPCTVTKWNNMLDLTVLMFTLNYVGFDVIRRYYNEYFADNYHPQLRYDNLTSFFEEYNHLDRRAHMEYVYINPESAGEGMWEIINSGSQLCTTDINDGGRKLRRKQQLPDVSLARRAEGPVAVRADKRLVWIGRGDTNSAGIPSLSTILGAIDSGQLSLHYARWEWASGTATSDVQGPFLELAYWIGPTPGVPTLDDQRFDMYRDQTPRPDRIGPDQWVGK
jgi:chitinase